MSPEFGALSTAAQVRTALDDAINLALAYCDHHYTEVGPGVAAGENLPELLREALERAAESRGAEELVRHRPGSWEADWLMQVLGYERDFESGTWTGPGAESVGS